jgi:hypothetical protein
VAASLLLILVGVGLGVLSDRRRETLLPAP